MNFALLFVGFSLKYLYAPFRHFNDSNFDVKLLNMTS